MEDSIMAQGIHGPYESAYKSQKRSALGHANLPDRQPHEVIDTGSLYRFKTITDLTEHGGHMEFDPMTKFHCMDCLSNYEKLKFNRVGWHEAVDPNFVLDKLTTHLQKRSEWVDPWESVSLLASGGVRSRDWLETNRLTMGIEVASCQTLSHECCFGMSSLNPVGEANFSRTTMALCQFGWSVASIGKAGALQFRDIWIQSKPLDRLRLNDVHGFIKEVSKGNTCLVLTSRFYQMEGVGDFPFNFDIYPSDDSISDFGFRDGEPIGHCLVLRHPLETRYNPVEWMDMARNQDCIILPFGFNRSKIPMRLLRDICCVKCSIWAIVPLAFSWLRTKAGGSSGWKFFSEGRVSMQPPGIVYWNEFDVWTLVGVRQYEGGNSTLSDLYKEFMHDAVKYLNEPFWYSLGGLRMDLDHAVIPVRDGCRVVLSLPSRYEARVRYFILLTCRVLFIDDSVSRDFSWLDRDVWHLENMARYDCRSPACNRSAKYRDGGFLWEFMCPVLSDYRLLSLHRRPIFESAVNPGIVEEYYIGMPLVGSETHLVMVNDYKVAINRLITVDCATEAINEFHVQRKIYFKCQKNSPSGVTLGDLKENGWEVLDEPFSRSSNFEQHDFGYTTTAEAECVDSSLSTQMEDLGLF